MLSVSRGRQKKKGFKYGFVHPSVTAAL
uniref:Uncharacterized protein n=1 Tax=Anguilla anguilla TaxID=7936 RepID=A0A0E9UCA9_ANGAN